MFWIELLAGVLRVADAPQEDRPPYRALGVLAFHGDVAIVHGLHGRVRPKEVLAFYRDPRQRGMRWMLAERTHSHRLPRAGIVRSGLFSGWWRVDLSQFDDDDEVPKHE